MELIEISNEFSNIWNTFFLPFFEFFVIIIVIFFILGKEFFYNIQEKTIEFNGITFRKRKGIYVPVKSWKKLIKHNFISFYLIFLSLVYVTDKLIFGIAQIFPFTYYFINENLLLFSVDENTIAAIWSYCPTLPFSELLEQISLLSKNTDIVNYDYTILSNNINNLCIFLFVLSIILIFIPKTKKKLLRIKKVFIIWIISLITILMASLYNFNQIVNETQQKCYYVLQYYQLEKSNKPEDNAQFNSCFIKVQKKKEEFKTCEHKEVFGVTWKNNITFEKIYELIQKISFKID